MYVNKKKLIFQCSEILDTFYYELVEAAQKKKKPNVDLDKIAVKRVYETYGPTIVPKEH